MATTKYLSLLSNLSRIEIPFVKVTIGDYTFGVYSEKTILSIPSVNYSKKGIAFPNYVGSLQVKKINGTVNRYTLQLKYVVTSDNDPNFIDKVLSSVSDTRKIIFSYGDLSTPSFIYKEETAIILKSRTSVDFKSPSLIYTISAVSEVLSSLYGKYTFPATTDYPSSIIKSLLWDSNDSWGLQELFYGMRNNRLLVESERLIADDDAPVFIEAKQNISLLDYLKFLVDNMVPSGVKQDIKSKESKNSFYSLVIVDDTEGKLGGPYFKVVKIDGNSNYNNNDDIYEITIGFPNDNNFILDFTIDDDESYSIFYKFNDSLVDSNYSTRINDNGEIYEEYTPIVGTNPKLYKPTSQTIAWWNKITNFPIKVTLVIKGLLKPAVLMSYVKLNVLFFGKQYVATGTYIITSQEDTINSSGFSTRLQLLRVDNTSNNY